MGLVAVQEVIEDIGMHLDTHIAGIMKRRIPHFATCKCRGANEDNFVAKAI